MPWREDEDGVRIELRRYLGDRLAPLTLLLVVVTCLSAPLAFFVLGRAALEVRADVTAHEVAGLIRRDVEERPFLWKYDSVKILDDVGSYAMPGVAAIVVVDAAGARIDEREKGPDLANLDALWRKADITVNRRTAGAVWVATSTVELERDTLALLLGFSALGLVLGGLIYWVPMRAIGRAGQTLSNLLRQLEESQGALARLNGTLEQQVEERSAELLDAYAELKRKERNLREISARAVRLQEAERRGIARELHDSAGQALTAIRIHLQLMGDLLEASAGPEAKTTVLARRTLDMVDDTVEEIRRAVNQLGPAVLDDVGLEAAVLRAADDVREAVGVEIDCEVDLGPERGPGLDASIETTTYRIVQESLTNVTRHAQAETVEVSIVADEARICIEVRDDGVGFEASEVGPRRRGLVGMRERVELLGGEVEVISSPGKGTHIRVSIPLLPDASESSEVAPSPATS